MRGKEGGEARGEGAFGDCCCYLSYPNHVNVLELCLGMSLSV